MKYESSKNLRGYFFSNMYLSDKQHGIQTSHTVAVMASRYGRGPEGYPERDMYYQFVDHGMTKIVLNGGYQSTLQKVYEILETVCPKLGLPYARFYEEQDALNGALTNVGVILPEEIYDYDTFFGDTVVLPRVYRGLETLLYTGKVSDSNRVNANVLFELVKQFKLA